MSVVVAGAHAQQALDAKAASAWYAGVTVEGTTADGQTFRAFHDAAGRVKAVVAGQYPNEGTWVVRDDGAVCVDWRDASWGRKPCFWIKEDKAGDWQLERVDDPKNVTRVKRIEGNKYNL